MDRFKQLDLTGFGIYYNENKTETEPVLQLFMKDASTKSAV